MPFLVLLLPILAWGLYAPFPAFYFHLFLVASFEALLVIKWISERPQFVESKDVPKIRQKVLSRYHQYFKNPVAARGLAKLVLAGGYVSMAWAAWLLFHRSWLAAFAAVLIAVLAPYLAALFHPRIFLEDIAEKDSEKAMELFVFEAIRQEFLTLDPDWPG